MVTLSRFMLSVSAAAALLAGCGGGGGLCEWKGMMSLALTRMPPDYRELPTRLSIERSIGKRRYAGRIVPGGAVLVTPEADETVCAPLKMQGVSVLDRDGGTIVSGPRKTLAEAARSAYADVRERGKRLAANAVGLRRWGYRKILDNGTRSFEPGELHHTGRPLDLALQDPTGTLFFELDRGGKTLYVRTVRLIPGKDGLTAEGGLRPKGTPGEMPGAPNVEVSAEGWIRTGTTGAAGGTGGILRLARLVRPAEVETLDGWAFSSRQPEAFMPYASAGEGPVRSGYLETPNITVEEAASGLALIEQQEVFLHAVMNSVGVGPETDGRTVRIRAPLGWTGGALINLAGGKKLADGTISLPSWNQAKTAETVLKLMGALENRMQTINDNLAHAGDTASKAEGVYRPLTVRMDDAGNVLVEKSTAEARKIYEPNNAAADNEGYVYRPAIFPKVAQSELEKSAAEYEVLRDVLRRLDPDLVCPARPRIYSRQNGGN
ncbi:MAG: hypothetical protein JW909_01955 [Planctomycetes bacterium]|nr:hypothetical protein [Planctomycetota bacterium]